MFVCLDISIGLIKLKQIIKQLMLYTMIHLYNESMLLSVAYT